MGSVLLQVTGHRLPCFKLGHKLHRPDILKPFLQSGYSGFYYRVLREGTLTAGDEIEVVERDPRGVTVRALLGVHRMGEDDVEVVAKALEVPSLAGFVREDLEARAAKR
jgi:MOSC domain-containing protein YiiM